ncbi:MAG: carbohydrate kinase family protein [Candidatus Cryosericum sp.]
MFYVTGDLNIDATTVAPVLSPLGKEAQAHIAISCGGQGGNVAWFLAALGQQVQLFGTLGRDTAGDLYLAHLGRCGIAFAGDCVDMPTGMVSVIQEADSYHMYRQRGANRVVNPARFADFLHTAVTASHSCLFISGYSLLNDGCAARLVSTLAHRDRTGTVVALDPASIDAMQSTGRDAVLAAAGVCDFLLPNCEEACWLAQEPGAEAAARTLHRLTGATVVVKLGEQGAILCSGDQLLRSPGLAVPVLDVTGAGDAFAAAFLLAKMNAKGDQAALDAAVAFSAAKVQFVGTQPPELLHQHR